MDNINTKPKSKVFFAIALSFFLIVAPVLTVSFSKFGLDKFRNVKKELTLLKDSIRLDSFLSVSSLKDTFSNKSIKGRLAIFQFYDNNNSKSWSELKRVQNEFGKNSEDNLKVLYFSLSLSDIDSNFILKNELKMDSLNWFVFNDNNLKNAIFNKAKITEQDAKHKLLLIDSKGYFCKVYDTRDSNEINGLLRHISVIIPKIKRKKYVYKKDNTFFENEE